jgi:hypothetical protein
MHTVAALLLYILGTQVKSRHWVHYYPYKTGVIHNNI